MLLYSSNYLEISYEHQYERCILDWIDSPPTIDLFKTEIKKYVEIALTFKSKQALWLQQRLVINMDNEIISWLEENMNKPIIESILKDNFYPFDHNQNYPVALVLGQKEFNLFQLTRLTDGRSNKSLIIEKMPRYFGNESEARTWLDQWKPFQEEPSFHELESSNKSIDLLTRREKEILECKKQGKSPKVIADELNISILTVRTHWKNIKKKITVKSSIDLS